MKHKIVSYLFLFVLLSSFVSAICTVTIDPSEYKPIETVVAEMICTENQERNRAYTLSWFNGTAGAAAVEIDVGTTPLTILTPFFETLLLPDNIVWTNANATLEGSFLEGFDLFNVSGSSANLLLINNAFFSPNALLGAIFAVDFEVMDNANNNSISNAFCSIYGTNQDDAPLQECGEKKVSYNGRGVCSKILDNEVFMEGNQYLAKIRCNCGIGDNACFDEAGNTIEKKAGESIFVFTVERWLEVNTITDKTEYTINVDEEVMVCANVTNNMSQRRELLIRYNYRCGAPDNATDRIIIDSLEERRGINANTTQNQCASLKLINLPSLQNQVSSCYAATDVHVIAKNEDTILFTYQTTSPDFNITSESNVFNEEEVNNMEGIALLMVSIMAVSLFLSFTIKLRDEQGVIVPIAKYTKYFFFFFGMLCLFFSINLMYGISLESNFSENITASLSTIYFIGLWFTVIILFIVTIGTFTNEIIKIWEWALVNIGVNPDRQRRKK